jgi:arylsulfatase A-like enzyme
LIGQRVGTDAPDPHGLGTSAQVLLIAVWFGLAAGMVEAVTLLVFRRAGLLTWYMRELNVSLDFLWIAPLVNVAFFIAIGLLLLVVTAPLRFLPLLKHLAPADIALFVFTWLACFIPLNVPNRLRDWSMILLSLGLAVQISLWLRRRRSTARAWLRRSVVWLLVTVAVTGVVIHGGSIVLERNRLRALPVTAPGAPNIVLIVLDAVRADHLSTYGYERATTPNIDRIAAEGVLFEHAITPSSWTLPSHASLFTGRYVHEHRADSSHAQLDDEYPTLAEVLAAQGYATAGFSGNVEWATSGAGLARGFIHFEDYFKTIGDVITRTVLGRQIGVRLAAPFGIRDRLDRRHGVDLTRAFTAWLDANPGRPFFTFFNYFDAHSPYAAPAPYHTKFMTPDQQSLDVRLAVRPTPPEDRQVTPLHRDFWMAAYDGGLASLDSEIGHLFDELRKRGLLERSLIIITADHGEAFREHGLYGHGHGLNLEQLRVPLIIRLPGGAHAGLRVSKLVPFVNIPATILSLTGGDAPRQIPGESLSRFWQAGSSATRVDDEPLLSEVGYRMNQPDAWPIHSGWVKSLITPDWHFIQQEKGHSELYRWPQDLGEQVNLADSAEGKAVVASFRVKLHEIVAAPRSARALPPR